ncbi:MAG: addiction module protein [Deltaproteobacteria bacterium]|nr:addiction module protein [Deltaproteobacteria bacterium]
MVAFDVLLEQVLQLPAEERARLAARLLRSLEPEDGDEVTGPAWEAAWSEELHQRLSDVDEGAEDLRDGDAALADARAWLDAQR